MLDLNILQQKLCSSDREYSNSRFDFSGFLRKNNFNFRKITSGHEKLWIYVSSKKNIQYKFDYENLEMKTPFEPLDEGEAVKETVREKEINEFILKVKEFNVDCSRDPCSVREFYSEFARFLEKFVFQAETEALFRNAKVLAEEIEQRTRMRYSYFTPNESERFLAVARNFLQSFLLPDLRFFEYSFKKNAKSFDKKINIFSTYVHEEYVERFKRSKILENPEYDFASSKFKFDFENHIICEYDLTFEEFQVLAFGNISERNECLDYFLGEKNKYEILSEICGICSDIANYCVVPYFIRYDAEKTKNDFITSNENKQKNTIAEISKILKQSDSETFHKYFIAYGMDKIREYMNVDFTKPYVSEENSFMKIIRILENEYHEMIPEIHPLKKTKGNGRKQQYDSDSKERTIGNIVLDNAFCKVARVSDVLRSFFVNRTKIVENSKAVEKDTEKNKEQNNSHH